MRKTYKRMQKKRKKSLGLIILLIAILLVISIILLYFAGIFGRITGNVVKQENLVAYYKFDYVDFSNILVDSSGKGNHARTSGSYQLVSGGMFGKALRFSGADSSYITAFNSNSLALTSGATISAWVKPEEILDSMQIVNKPGQQGYYNYLLSLSSAKNRGKAAFSTGLGTLPSSTSNYGGSGVSSSVLQPGIWYHVVGVFDSATRTSKIYVNGIKENEHIDPFLTLGVSSKDLIIGKNFKGIIDDVKIWNTALTDAEIAKEAGIISLVSYSIVAPSIVSPGEKFQIKCNYGEQLPCVGASHDSKNCTWSKWEGNDAVFECTATNIGTKENYCTLFNYNVGNWGSKCKAKSDKITNIIVSATSPPEQPPIPITPGQGPLIVKREITAQGTNQPKLVTLTINQADANNPVRMVAIQETFSRPTKIATCAVSDYSISPEIEVFDFNERENTFVLADRSMENGLNAVISYSMPFNCNVNSGVYILLENDNLVYRAVT